MTTKKKNDKVLSLMVAAGALLLIGGGIIMYNFVFSDTEALAEQPKKKGMTSWEDFNSQVAEPEQEEPKEERGDIVDDHLEKAQRDSLKKLSAKSRSKEKSEASGLHTDLTDIIKKGDKTKSRAGAPADDPADAPSVDPPNVPKASKRNLPNSPKGNHRLHPPISEVTPTAPVRRVRKESDIAWEGKNESSPSSNESTDENVFEFEAIVHGKNLVQSGHSSRLSVRTIANINLGDCVIEAGKIYIANVTGSSGSRLNFKLILPCHGKKKSFEVYDEDGERGLYVESLNKETDAKKGAIQRMAQTAINTVAAAAGGHAAGTAASSAGEIADAKTGDYSIVVESGKKIQFKETK